MKLKWRRAGPDPEEGDWVDLPPKTYESIFFHRNFVQFGKQHMRYKANVLSQQGHEVCFLSLTVPKLLWDLTT